MLICVLLGLSSCNTQADTVTIGDQIFHVSYAATDAEKAQGLMFVETMPSNGGMVFLYDTPQVTKFWMKNTLISLDILFFNEKAELVYIEHEAQPQSLLPRGPEDSVCVVVEIKGGEAHRRGIKTGDKLLMNRAHKCLQSSSE